MPFHKVKEAFPLLPPRCNKRLRLHAQCIRDPRNVVEVTDHLHRVVDGAIVKAMLAQFIQIAWRHLVLRMGELGRKGAERVIGSGERSGAPVPRNRVDQFIRMLRIQRVGDLSTEVVGMRLGSVGAGQLGRDDRSQHFALHPRERGIFVHNGLV